MPVTIKKKDDEVGNAMGTQSSVTLVKAKKVSKAEGDVLQSNALLIDDIFSLDYFDAESSPNAKVLKPPFNPSTLSSFCQENNALGQCIAAMEVNIDGTGYEVTASNGGEEQTDAEKKEAEGITEFFDEIFPTKSFITVRRELRRDQEASGNSYLEVLRSISGDIVFAKALESVSMRLLKLDDPVPVSVTIMRFGSEQNVTIIKRERRFVQKIGDKSIFFKEFNASRDLNKWTGIWAEQGQKLPVEDRATEVIHFYPIRDVTSPYGLPRWINQIPSILGSRKAEELNLDFFNAGGLPPAIIAIQGGELTEPVRKQLNTYLSGKGASKHRAAIIEVQSTGGSLDSAGNVRMTVERFGAERQQDSMFENYDSRCEKRVRSSFRLPPMFVGKADDYSFATAFASYTVAEAQVFQPERSEFDEIMNNTIMKHIAPGFTFRSLPLAVRDATQQLKGIELSKDALDKEGFIKAINEVTNMNLKIPEGVASEPVVKPTEEPVEGEEDNADIINALGRQSTPQGTQKVSKIDPMEMIELAGTWAAYSSGADTKIDPLPLYEVIKSMPDDQRTLFDAYVSIKLMSGFDNDPEGATELMGAATDILMMKHECCDQDHGT